MEKPRKKIDEICPGFLGFVGLSTSFYECLLKWGFCFPWFSFLFKIRDEKSQILIIANDLIMANSFLGWIFFVLKMIYWRRSCRILFGGNGIIHCYLFTRIVFNVLVFTVSSFFLNSNSSLFRFLYCKFCLYTWI